MKVQTTERTITMSGDFKQTQAKIICNEAMFTLLADKLYRNKIRAAIRELCCNAADAHKEGGNAEPFVVSLPNGLEPYFKVTDEGLGLAECDVLDLYQNFGASTRSDTDEVTGGFGLGSKAPYAYTQTFNVISRFGGEKRTYVCFRDSKGVPSTTLMAAENTEEGNGLEVSFRVEPRDFDEFYTEAAHVLKAFKQAYKVVGHDIELPEEVVERAGEGWSVLAATKDRWGYQNNNQASVVRMGNVDYPIPVESLSKLLPANRKVWSEINVILEAPVGALSPTPSREDLEINEAMESFLESKLQEIRGCLLEQIVHVITSCTSMWNARIALRLLREDSTFQLVTDSGSHDVPRWNGQEIRDTIVVGEVPGARVTKYTRDQKYVDYTYKACVKSGDSWKFKPKDSDVLVLDNLSGTDFKLKNYVRHEMVQGQRLFLITVSTKAALKAILKIVGKGVRELRLASELDLSEDTKAALKAARDANRKPRADGTPAPRRKKGTVRGYQLSDTCGEYAEAEKFWELIEDGVPYKGRQGVYVVIHRWETEDVGGLSIDRGSLRRAIRVLKKYHWEDFELIAVKKSDAKKLEAEPGWVTPDCIALDTYKLLVNSAEHRVAHELSGTSLKWSEWSTELVKHPFWGALKGKLYERANIIQNLFSLAKHENLATTSTLVSLMTAADISVDPDIKQDVLSLERLVHYLDARKAALPKVQNQTIEDRVANDPYTPLVELLDKYPMLFLTDLSKDADKLCDYINLVDSQETDNE